jgi:hypothetical protein
MKRNVENFISVILKILKMFSKKTTFFIVVITVGGCVVVSMGLLVLSLSVPEFYLTKDKSAAVDDQVETKLSRMRVKRKIPETM